jgi:hypothetical protein
MLSVIISAISPSQYPLCSGLPTPLRKLGRSEQNFDHMAADRILISTCHILLISSAHMLDAAARNTGHSQLYFSIPVPKPYIFK